MKVEIKIIEEYNDEEKFAKNVASMMEEMNTRTVKYTLTAAQQGNLYSAMIIKYSR